MIWKSSRLGDLMSIARGASPRPIKSYLTNSSDGINWIKIGDTEEGGKYIYSTKQKIKPNGLKHSRFVKAGDFLLSNSMSFGRPYILKIDGCIHDGWLVLSNYDKIFLPDYLYYLLSSSLIKNQFEKLARGSTVRNLNIDLVSNVVVNYPSLDDQQNIVNKLNKNFEKINQIIKMNDLKYENVKSLIDKAQNLLFEKKIKKSNIMKLKDIAEFENGDRGKNYPSRRYQISEGIPFVNAGDFSLDGDIKKDGMVYISEERFKLLGAGKFKLNDILFCLRGSLGKSAINKTFKTGAIASSLVILRAKINKISPDYLFAFMRSEKVKEYINKTAGGTAQPNLSAKVVSNYEIPVPSIHDQNIISEVFWNIRDKGLKTIELIKEKKKQLNNLKSSILTKILQADKI